MENRPISEIYASTGEEWVDADAAANLLEDCKSAFLSKKMQDLGNIPVSKAEAIVKASDEWEHYIEKMVNMRKRANLLKVKMESIKMRYWEQIGTEANRRAEMKL